MSKVSTRRSLHDAEAVHVSNSFASSHDEHIPFRLLGRNGATSPANSIRQQLPHPWRWLIYL
ncbi:hypothetical protein PILCRDRAFT_814558 [Piloderma croceum F 1598]|uniref:Uncharacterized protein n=1 Tax=Piloderma croceum (strain F 1598) TaxID=765440 RepID=A0A0C3CDQ9_PILCF|nr:hypothetical protein PILCRDRAFT_814558 [Piloderma croceum F 1598]